MFIQQGNSRLWRNGNHEIEIVKWRAYWNKDLSSMTLSINFFSLTSNFGLGLELGCLTGNFTLQLCHERTKTKFIFVLELQRSQGHNMKRKCKLACCVFLWDVYFAHRQLSWLHSYTNFCWCWQVLLDGQTITFKNLKAGTAAGGQADPNVREVCVCANGKVFLAPVNSRCQVSLLC